MLLDSISVLELTIVASDPRPPAECVAGTDYSVKVDFDVRGSHDAEPQVLVPLHIEFRAPRDGWQPFDRVAVRLLGVFSAAPEADPEAFRSLVPQNCLVILSGVARGLLMNATAGFPGGPFILPAINYLPIIKRKADQMRRKHAKEAAPLEQPPV
jgi:preprotein translocase subunit SecB